MTVLEQECLTGGTRLLAKLNRPKTQHAEMFHWYSVADEINAYIGKEKLAKVVNVTPIDEGMVLVVFEHPA